VSVSTQRHAQYTRSLVFVPVFGSSHGATVHGAIVKRVQREQCGARYVYQMERSAQGSGLNPYLLDERGAAWRAKVRARSKLDQRLEKDCEVVPCPECGFVSAEMVKEARRRYLA